jgi:hypothetical protein
MTRFLSLTLALSLAAFLGSLTIDTASAQTTPPGGKAAQGAKWGSFDDDGDGILNCQDPDYVRPHDGTGKKLGKMHGGKSMNGKGGYGPGNGAGNNGIGPRDGSGYGKTSGAGSGTGVCDGTGPKGKGRNR